MLEISKIINELEIYSPLCFAESYDNVGLLLGDRNESVSKVLISLDLTGKAMQEAIDLGANLIITHHPILFDPINKINTDDPDGRLIINMIKNNISHYAAHTNLDSAQNGINTILADMLGVKDTEVISPTFTEDKANGNTYGIGLSGRLSAPTPLGDYIKLVSKQLNMPGIKYVGNLDRKIEKVALCSGSGSSLFNKAVSMGAELFISADLKYSTARLAEELDVCLIDAGHFETENIICNVLTDHLNNIFKGKCEFFSSERHNKSFWNYIFIDN